jgi:hypothetical protein
MAANKPTRVVCVLYIHRPPQEGTTARPAANTVAFPTHTILPTDLSTIRVSFLTVPALLYANDDGRAGVGFPPTGVEHLKTVGAVW